MNLLTAAQEPVNAPVNYAKAVAAGLSIPVLGAVDFLTGFELAFSTFYFIPVAFAAWYGGAGPGFGASILCAITWVIADFASGHTYSASHYYLWNTVIRFAAFTTVLLLVLDRRRLLALERTRATTDPLTGLLNHRGFTEALQVECARSARHGHALSVAYLDLDDFKRVNDTAGHHAGDSVLVTFANSLRSVLRKEDLSARLGGDEFALLLPETDTQNAQTSITRIHTILREALSHTGFDVGVSIGCVSFDRPPDEPTDLLRAADQAMYLVKARGKNAVVAIKYAEHTMGQSPISS